MVKIFVPEKRFKFFVLIVCLAFACIFARLFYLHVIAQDRLARIAERNRQKLETIQARRGNIVDVKGNILATTRPVVTVGVDPQVYQEEGEEKLFKLAEILHVPVQKIAEAVSQKTMRTDGPDGKEVRLVRWKKLVDAVDEPTYEKIKSLKIKGVYGTRKFDRIYPGGQLAAHVLGFVNKENVPAFGVERLMDFYLKGQDGWIESEKDGRRRELPQFRTREIRPTDGENVELTIDLNIQSIVEKEIEKVVEEYKPESVSIIVSDPTTGYILALANYPHFDLNEYGKAPLDWHRNRSISDLYEPGSAFKIVSFGAAVNEKVVSLDETIDCSLSVVPYRGRNVKMPKDDRPMETLTVPEVLVKSSNRGIAQLAMRVGSEKYHQYCKDFGFGELTGYGFEGEVRGILHDPKHWDGLTISRMPMGHAIAVTPIQMHYAMGAVANDGVLMQPQITRRIFDNDNNTILDFKPRARRRVLSYETASILSKVMSGKLTPDVPKRPNPLKEFSIAAKSGTSQKIDENGRYTSREHVASYVGFLPAERPRLVISVVVDKPQVRGTGYGGRVAKPSFMRIAEQAVRYMGVQPEKG